MFSAAEHYDLCHSPKKDQSAVPMMTMRVLNNFLNTISEKKTIKNEAPS